MSLTLFLIIYFLQYLGDVTAPKVKDKIKSLLYSWKLGLPNEPKIQEAYEMLKREGKTHNYMCILCMFVIYMVAQQLCDELDFIMFWQS